MSAKKARRARFSLASFRRAKHFECGVVRETRVATGLVRRAITSLIRHASLASEGTFGGRR